MPELPREERFAAVFAELSDTLVRDFDVVDFLHTLTERCVDLLDVAAAGVLLGMPHGQVVDAAASDDRTRALELSGLEWDEGPCRDCYYTQVPVCDVRLDTEAAGRRWPRFTPRARQLGYTSVVAAPLHWQGQVIGALNLFRDRRGALDGSQLRLAQALANIATLAVLQQRAVYEQTNPFTQTQDTLNTRVVVEQAKGCLAQHHGTGMDEALATMRVHALRHRLSLAGVARQILDGGPAGLAPQYPEH
ncbi:GAF and ANTAR domain-containing protein [Streptomyces sp. BH-SS-21]|uniref:GAF and ANTAR domain-containing protein n=1 Tax=Streptomyces liliiviolaceus TaxID=2823109 RepID=A0A940Y5B7_9ACTN|nr:GAF and ANTAR domain-containing protein [Streptomyces liliiviolaceus]